MLVELAKHIRQITNCSLDHLSLALGFMCLNLSRRAHSSLPFTFGESPSTTFVQLSSLQFFSKYCHLRRWSTCFPFAFNESSFLFEFTDLSQLIQVLSTVDLDEVMSIG
uniref:Uncharacterized protein n=1 Tax=Solanum tuberosum TaxID=4113 RepID=M1DIZ8_SOLTU